MYIYSLFNECMSCIIYSTLDSTGRTVSDLAKKCQNSLFKVQNPMKYDYMKNQNIQIRKGWKALLWNQVKSKMESSYSELVLVDDNDIDNLVVNICSVVGSIC